MEAWPAEELEEHAADVAGAAFELLRSKAAWRHRRVETITVLSHEDVRRAVSVDFTVPAKYRDHLIVSGAGECVVPLAGLAKRPLVHFDLRNEEGHSVPLLTAEQNRLIDRELLYVALEEDLETQDAGEAVRAAAERAAGPVIEAVLGGGAPAGALDRLEREHALAPLTVFRAWAEILERSFILWAVVGGLDRRRVLKFASDEPFSLRAGFTHDYDAPGATEAASYHLEVAVPAELRARSTTLEDYATAEVLAAGERDTDRPAIYYAADPARAPARPVARVRYGAERGRFLVPAALVTAVITLLLALPLALADLDALAAESGPAIGIVLSVSAVFSVLVLRTDEHPLLRLILLRFRLCLVAGTLAALLAAAVLGFRAGTWLLHAGWALAAAISAGAAGILILAAARSPASRSRPAPSEP
ncbi:MAG: hypothetical protein ACRDPC_12470 [Solirubrobacteraceae bacterium]